VNRELAEAVVGCLSLSSGTCEVNVLRKFRLRDWERTFSWLDRADLTLYFFQRLKSITATEVLPPPVSTRFEQNLADNRRRVDHLVAEFGSLNERFDRAGVNYAVIKGFSLVRAFCPDAALRAPSDLDYLVDKPSLPVAQAVLAEAGYCLQRFSDIEFKFGRPSPRIPTISDDPYSVETEPLVELHVAFCKGSENRVLMNEPEFRLDRTISHDWEGLRFPVLREEDAFVFQILHVFQHTLEGWVKLCWLFEIGYFLRTRSSDAQFWDRVDVRMREVPCLSEFAAIVMGLTDRVFGAPMPPIAANWTQCLRAPARVWLQNYGRSWAIEDHPFDTSSLFSAAKLCLFLHREFVSDPQARKEITRQRLFPWKLPEQIAVPADNTAASFLTARRLQWQFVLQKLLFHLSSSSRYLLEMAHWRELNRLSPGLLASESHKSHQPDATPTGNLSSPEVTPN
jgi:Uncharacterised nucleotidyltransferase